MRNQRSGSQHQISEMRNQDTTDEDTTKEDTTKEYTIKEDTTKEDTTDEDTTNKDTTKEDTTNKDTTKEDTTKQRAEINSSREEKFSFQLDCDLEAADREDDVGAVDQDGPLPQFPGGTTKSSPPRSLYDFWVKSRKGDNTDRCEEKGAGRMRSAKEGERGPNHVEEPGIEVKMTRVGGAIHQKPAEESSGPKGKDRRTLAATFQEESGCPR
ncbi:hypothetical protein NDU88_000439 [Pleurodeles waltl]|uniref:Uncharacterized protein n=1 Tax=Pleurodeles waltl TaxID=8319 RepID=A0AAV7KPX8_PLEWA|nr:hypothetical protein NDU88_000439 [Pleurodeles waltl]